MTFATPIVVWGLIGPALAAVALAVLGLVRRRRSWTRWPGITRVVAIGARVHPVSVAHGTRRPWLLLAALALALVALAGPRWGVIDEPVFQKSREVMLALDLSRSMLTQDVLPSRLERSRLLVRSLLDGLRGERVGLIVFAGTAFVQVPMSSDYQILEEFLPELKPGYMPQGGTDYDGMLRSALTGFSDAANTDRYLIVLSDGEAQDEQWRDRIPALREKGIHAITLGIGTTAGGFIPDPKTGAYVKDARGAVVLSKLDPATLQALAFETSGTYRDGSSWVDLAALLEETVERGRQGAYTDKREARAIERFQWFLAPALLCALAGLWREIPIRPRARDTRAAGDARDHGRARRRVAGSTAALFALACALLATPRSFAAVQDQTPASAIDKLRATVTRLSSTDTVPPAGWKAMAEQTLALGQEMRKNRQPVEPGVVNDALAAVDAGERADARAADWSKLREDLRHLLDQPPPDQKPEQKPEEKKNDEEKKDQKEQQNQQQNPEQQDNQDEQQKQPQQQQQQQNSQEQAKQDAQKQSDTREQPQQQQPKPQASGEPPKTRKFGGKQDKEQKTSAENPELAAALARLDQVQDRDRPAILHQRLEQATEKQQPQASGAANSHDW